MIKIIYVNSLYLYMLLRAFRVNSASDESVEITANLTYVCAHTTHAHVLACMCVGFFLSINKQSRNVIRVYYMPSNS